MITVWTQLSGAPHRLFFFAGAIQAILSVSVWSALLAARMHGQVPDLPLPAAWLHGGLLMFATFPFFVTGFTLTAVPNWLGERGVDRRVWLPAFVAMAAGAGLIYPGLIFGAGLLGVGLGLHLAGWVWATLAVQRLIMHSRHPGKRHFYMAIAVIVCGQVAELLFMSNLVFVDPVLNAVARSGALWLFLVPTFFSISHRVIPAFTRMAVKDAPLYQPLWMLPVMMLACLAHFLLDVAGQPGWLWLADLPLLCMAILLSARWKFFRHVAHPLVGIHHLAFGWLTVALSLLIAQSLGAPLGLAPLHALVSGYFGSMLIGMAARVVFAHSGQPIVFPSGLRASFLMYQLAPLLRIGADLPDVTVTWAHALYVAAGLIWVACWGVWLRLMTPLLLRAEPH